MAIHCTHCKTSRSVVNLRLGFVCKPSTFCLLQAWECRRFHIFQFVSVLNLRKHNFSHWANFGSCWQRTARHFSHACAEKADEELPRSYHLLLVCPRDTPNIWCKFSHTSPDLLIRSGQVKKCFSSGERASGRKKSVVNSVYLKERHVAYCFSTLSWESYFRAALFGLNHSNRIVFFERVPRNLFVSDLNLKRYSFEKYTVLIAF